MFSLAVALANDYIATAKQPTIRKLPMTSIFYGTNENDFFSNLTTDDHFVFGLRGNDIIMDVLTLDGSQTSSYSDDIFLGGGGNDWLISRGGDDFLFGGKGRDQFQAINGDQIDLDMNCITIDGGAGRDRAKLYGFTGDETIVEMSDRTVVHGDDMMVVIFDNVEKWEFA